jgi:hypothetical protein
MYEDANKESVSPTCKEKEKSQRYKVNKIRGINEERVKTKTHKEGVDKRKEYSPPQFEERE